MPYKNLKNSLSKQFTQPPVWYFRTTFIFLLCLVALGFVADFCYFAIQYIRAPYIIDYGEGCVLTFLHHLKEYGTYFFPLNDYPYSYATYPPLFIALSRWMNLLIASPLESTRLISSIASLGCGFLIFLIIKQLTRNRVIGFIGAAMFLASYFTYLFGPLGRVDTLTVFFSLLGLYSFHIHAESQSPKKYFSFFFFACAFFTKQSAIFAPASIFIFTLFYASERKNFLKYSLVYGSLIFLGLISLNIYTHGEALRHLFFYTSERKIGLSRALYFMHGFLEATNSLWIFTLLALAFFRKIFTSYRLIYLIYLVLNILVLPAPAATSGNINYYIEPLAALIIFSAIGVELWTKAKEILLKQRLAREFVAAFAVLLYFFLCLVYSCHIRVKGTGSYDYPLAFTFPWIADEYARLSKFVAKTEGDVLCEDLSLLVLNNKTIFFGCSYPPAEQGTWFPEKVVADCQNQRFEYIIMLSRYQLIPELKSCIQKNYKLHKRFGFYFVYGRKKEAALA